MACGSVDLENDRIAWHGGCLCAMDPSGSTMKTVRNIATATFTCCFALVQNIYNTGFVYRGTGSHWSLRCKEKTQVAGAYLQDT